MVSVNQTLIIIPNKDPIMEISNNDYFFFTNQLEENSLEEPQYHRFINQKLLILILTGRNKACANKIFLNVYRFFVLLT